MKVKNTSNKIMLLHVPCFSLAFKYLTIHMWNIWDTCSTVGNGIFL